jgi:hypothetical protein
MVGARRRRQLLHISACIDTFLLYRCGFVRRIA